MRLIRLLLILVTISVSLHRDHLTAAAEAPSDEATSSVEEEDGEDVSYPLRCLMRQFNFTATVTDANGKQCRGQVNTKACFGSCESYEVGTFEFPWIVRVQPVCNYNGVVMKEISLSDCDDGVDSEALIYRFPEASSCSCSICDPKEQTCESHPVKRSVSLHHMRKRSLDAAAVIRNEKQYAAHQKMTDKFHNDQSGSMIWSQLIRERRK